MSLDWKYQESFPSRHIGPDAAEQARMLEALGLPSLEALLEQTVPAAIRTQRPLDLGPGTGELDLLEEVRALAQRNVLSRSFLGMGYHDCFLPTVIQRNVLESPGWYTAYTPYQAEIAQGRLEALFNFQTMVTDLTGLEIANASLLDEATAAAEGMALAFHARKKPDCRAFFADALCHPQTLAVLRTRAEPLGIEVRVGDPSRAGCSSGCFGALVQYPSTDGGIRDLRPMAESVHAEGGLLVVAADLLALTLLTPPGELGADVAVGSTQRFGVPMGYGGPHAAYFATRAAYVRQVPGRIIGLTQDAEGRPALRMALQTREQHIRRERATSNICTSQVLLAVISSMYAVYHGPEGLTRIAERVHGLTVLLAKGLAELGFPLRHSSFFDTLAVEVGPGKAEAIRARAFEKGMLFRTLDEHTVGLALDETTRAADLQAIWEAFAGEAADDGKKVAFSPESLGEKVEPRLPEGLRRESAFLTHPVFNTHCSESEMLRYIKRLESKDLSLAQSMIPLGSCTMKLNATTEMIPVTWSKFGRLHPFAPLALTEGYQRLFADLKRMLAEITGFPAVSLQPNAGSQGELSGLLAIRGWHASRGEGQRDVCLIPASAHGTNPASAVMAGLKVVVVRCDAQGNIELDDLEKKAKEHESRLAALMVTYPSTHGVFEEGIQRICEIVHAHGGQVYLDGANLNAQVGLCRPSEIGADVCHLNLHKTFCIPHGGGGPGMGPIAAAAHLAPFLPGHPVVPVDGRSEGAVAAAPWGSASILVISWAYIRMMGGEGLKRATEVAILSANYLAQRLSPHFPVLYKGRNGRVAHECILDLRAFKKSAGIEAEDVAKRLIDYGFHAPTLSFPVVGTLMIEPTESEPLAELDRFCEALIAIREEIRQVEEGKQPREGNVLKGAPHPAHLLAAAEWNRPYSREQAVYPTAAVHENKFWPAVGRLDAALGDRNLICSCPPVESY